MDCADADLIQKNFEVSNIDQAVTMPHRHTAAITAPFRHYRCEVRRVFQNAGTLDQCRNGCRMSEVERLRDKAERCHQLALVASDVEIERRLVALANEFEAKAVRAVCERGRLAQVAEIPDERRKLALINFNKSW
jgi:hypothetical protein